MTKKIRRQPWRSAYTEDMPLKLYEMRSEGKTMSQVAKALGVTKKTLYNWANDPDKEEFKEALEAGFEASQAWHEDLIYDIIAGTKDCKGAQKDLIQMKMRTHFREDWAEKRESTININDQTKTLTDAELDEKVEMMLNKALKLPPKLKEVKKEGSKD